jgi:ornithine cyclodeaminase/alanine dehydrogenase-like protein (mu-crystallin family)
MGEVIAALDTIFVRQSKGEIKNLPRTRTPIFDRSLNVTAATDSVSQRFAVKVYGAGGFHILLYQHRKDLLAIMEADWLGQLRTGAATGIATKLLARPESRSVGLIGAGRQARCQLLALQAIGMMDEVRVYSRDPSRREAFCAFMRTHLNCRIMAVTSGQAASAGADIMVTATKSKSAVLQRSWLEPGTHVTGMGANSKSRLELDLQIIEDAEWLVTDDTAQARIEGGEFLALDQKGQMDWGRLLPLCQLVGGAPLARSGTGITVFKSLGCGLEDLAVSSLLYDKMTAT